jgi:hypothetical protein
VVNVNEVIYFGYELELLEANIAEHRPHMNRIIVAECQVTTTGWPKPLFAKDNWSRFEKYDVEHMEIPVSLYNKITPSTDDPALPLEGRMIYQDKFKNVYAHPRVLDGADWIYHCDTDENIYSRVWDELKAFLGEHPDLHFVSHFAREAYGHVNTSLNKRNVYRLLRAKEGFDVRNPKFPIRQPRHLYSNRYLGNHYFACFSRPEEFYWKWMNRTWSWGKYGNNPPTWSEVESEVKDFMKYSGSFHKQQTDHPLLGYIKESVPDGYYNPETIRSLEALPAYMQEHIEDFPRIVDGVCIPSKYMGGVL